LAAPEGPSTTPVSVLRSRLEPGTIVLVIGDPIARSGIPELCERVRTLLENCDCELVVFDMSAFLHPTLPVVDALARLQLTARRLGCRVRLLDPGDELSDLIALVGLGDVVRLYPGLPLEARRQAEEWKEAGGVEEEADPRDPPP
jgi:hypothetical protein